MGNSNIYADRWIPVLGDSAAINCNARIGNNVRIGEGVIIEDGCSIGDNAFIGHNTVIRSGVKIGEHSIIGHLVMIESDTQIGEHTTIQSQCHITKFAMIEDRVFMGPKAMLINTHTISHGRGFKPELKGPHIGYAARIGSGSIIMPGVNVGENAVVGAGAIVTRDIPDREIWFGSPAGHKGSVPEKEIMKL